MYKVVLPLALLLCFVSCKKKCDPGKFSREICAGTDSTLAYHLILGKWNLRLENDGFPKSTTQCYGDAPKSTLEFLTDTTLIENTDGSPRLAHYKLSIGSVYAPNDLTITSDGVTGGSVTVCDNYLQLTRYSYNGVFMAIWTQEYNK